jgi:DNA-binding SARP family transcriptional activator
MNAWLTRPEALPGPAQAIGCVERTCRHRLRSYKWVSRQDLLARATGDPLDLGGVVRIHLVTLSRPRCCLDGKPLERLPGQRVRFALLIYLAVEREATREKLHNTFWPERTVAQARGALKQNVYELRRALATDWLTDDGGCLRVRSAVSTDLSAFVSAADTGRYEDALSLYQREFLADFFLPSCWPFEFWLDTIRARASRLHRVARRERLRELINRGDLAAALRVAREWAELDPAEDEAHHLLIELLLVTEGRAEALRQYALYERLLRQDDLTPLEQTREFVGRIRRGEVILPFEQMNEGSGRLRVHAAVNTAPSSLALANFRVFQMLFPDRGWSPRRAVGGTS